MVVSGFAFAQEQPEAERAALCGPRYAHDPERAAMRAGHAPSSLTVASRKNSLSGRYRCFPPVCSSILLLPVFPMAASSLKTDPIFRSGEDCRHFNFNTFQDMAVSTHRRTQ